MCAKSKSAKSENAMNAVVFICTPFSCRQRSQCARKRHRAAHKYHKCEVGHEYCLRYHGGNLVELAVLKCACLPKRPVLKRKNLRVAHKHALRIHIVPCSPPKRIRCRHKHIKAEYAGEHEVARISCEGHYSHYYRKGKQHAHPNYLYKLQCVFLSMQAHHQGQHNIHHHLLMRRKRLAACLERNARGL